MLFASWTYLLELVFVKSTFAIMWIIIVICALLSLYQKSGDEYITIYGRKLNVVKWIGGLIIAFGILIVGHLGLLFYLPEETLLLLNSQKLENAFALPYLSFVYYHPYFSKVGWTLFALCYFSAFITIIYLGDKAKFLNSPLSFYFLFFLTAVFWMVSTTNILVVFISFEAIFLPSIYFAYFSGYAKKSDKSAFFLVLWTLFGAFLITAGVVGLYSIAGTFEFDKLLMTSFSFTEKIFLFCIFFIGFGIKVPVFPFHYWLTKIHVEAPAGFSMFLSGFLVKTAIYCLFFFLPLFKFPELTLIASSLLVFSMIESSIKMWSQVDIKKLIAFATIQEMNMIFMALLWYQTSSFKYILLFIAMHGLLSVFMFFIVDLIQKRTQTRNILSLGGLGEKMPALRIFIWVMFIMYLGFPFTIKFLIEWQFLMLLIGNFGVVGLGIFCLVFVLGGIGFAKAWLLILYGTPSEEVSKLKITDISKKEWYLGVGLVVCFVLLNGLIFIL